MRIWSGGEVQKWHAVIITDNWVSGIPYQMPISCDSCVLRIPRTQVDSMKLDYKKANGLDALALVGITVALLAVEYVVCAIAGAKNGC